MGFQCRVVHRRRATTHCVYPPRGTTAAARPGRARRPEDAAREAEVEEARAVQRDHLAALVVRASREDLRDLGVGRQSCHLGSTLRRAAEATASFQAAHAVLWGE